MEIRPISTGLFSIATVALTNETGFSPKILLLSCAKEWLLFGVIEWHQDDNDEGVFYPFTVHIEKRHAALAKGRVDSSFFYAAYSALDLAREITSGEIDNPHAGA